MVFIPHRQDEDHYAEALFFQTSIGLIDGIPSAQSLFKALLCKSVTDRTINGTFYPKQLIFFE